MFYDLNKAFEASLVCTVVQPKLDYLRNRSQEFELTAVVSSGDPACQKWSKTIKTKNVNKYINKNHQNLKPLIYRFLDETLIIKHSRFMVIV